MKTTSIISASLALTLALASGAFAGFFGGGGSGSTAGGISGRVLYYDDCSSVAVPGGFGMTVTNMSYSSSLNAKVVGTTYTQDSGVYTNATSGIGFTLKESLTLEWCFVQRNTITGALYEQGAWLINNGAQTVSQGRFAASGPVTSLKNDSGATVASNATYVRNHQYTCRLTVNADKQCSFWFQDETQGYTSSTWTFASGLTFGAGTVFQFNIECANTTLTHVAVYDGVPAGASAAGGTVSPTFSGGTITSGINWTGTYNGASPQLGYAGLGGIFEATTFGYTAKNYTHSGSGILNTAVNLIKIPAGGSFKGTSMSFKIRYSVHVNGTGSGGVSNEFQVYDHEVFGSVVQDLAGAVTNKSVSSVVTANTNATQSSLVVNWAITAPAGGFMHVTYDPVTSLTSATGIAVFNIEIEQLNFGDSNITLE